MKYYSELTRNYYNTEKECLDAEFRIKEEQNREKIRKERELEQKKQEQEKLAAERKADAERVDAARKNMVAAQNEYKTTLDNFIKKYGSYHYSTHTIDDFPTLFDIFKPFIEL